MKNFQVAIIGGGVIGSAIAWELSHYNVRVVVFEKGSDVASETSKANSGVIHSGINSNPGSLKAQFCVQGNQMVQNLADTLGFNLQWVGKYVIAKNQQEQNELVRLKKIGRTNNVPDLTIVDGEHVQQKEPHVECEKALWVPTAGIILPYEFTIVLAENAAINNVIFHLETQVIGLTKHQDLFTIHTNKGDFHASLVINAAGLHCHEIVSMIEEPDFIIYPCRGEYLVLDKKYQSLIFSMIYPVPDKEKGVLGVHITPTIEGNLLLGPSAEFVDNDDENITTKKMMQLLLKEAKQIIPSLPDKAVINAYSGIRCKLASETEGGWADYRIEDSTTINGMINLIGIESPGLTAAPAIAKKVKDFVTNHIELQKKKTFTIKKISNRRFSEMTNKQQETMIQKDPRWGRIVCRCEHITEAEVIHALSNPLGAHTLSAVKYRCRAGMGRCQGGFCTQHVIRIMQEHFHIDIADMKLKSPNSYCFSKRTREETDG